MGIFRQFPYTNFHEMNLDSLIHCCNTIKEKMKILEDEMANFFVETKGIIIETVNKWLDDHPEATTTVQDHSLTEIKFTEELAYKTIKDYVTPSMYGAVGDGVEDDTQAFKDAIDSGKQVFVAAGDYNLSENIFADDSVVFEDNGTYNNKKLIISKNISNSGIAPAYQNQVYLGQYGLIGLQGVTYNNDRDTLILGSNNSSNNTPIIVEVDRTTLSFIRSLPSSAFGHCNDMTYVSDEKTIYVAPMDGNKIIPVDADLFVLKPTITVDNLATIHQIAYDDVNEIFYLSDGDRVYAYDKNFVFIQRMSDTHINTITLSNNQYDNIDSVYTQGTCVVNGQLLCLGWLWGVRGYDSFARISQLNYSVKDVTKINYDIPLLMTDDEVEALVMINDELYMFGYCSEALTITKINMDSNGEATNNIDFFSQGTNGAEIGIDRIRIRGNNNGALFRLNLKTLDDLTAGNSYYCTVSNIPDMEGMAIGYYADCMIMCLIHGTSINVRPFKNLPANVTFFVTGFITNGYLS